MGHFHIKCLEDITDLSSPAILSHITQGRTAIDYRLDIGAAAIVKAWCQKCKMDNAIATGIKITDTVSEVDATTDGRILNTDFANFTSSSTSTPAPSTSALSTKPPPASSTISPPEPSLSPPFQWQGKILVYMPDLEGNGGPEITGYGCHHDREAYLVPWSEDIVTGKLPGDVGLILEDDVPDYLDKMSLRTSDGTPWNILSYLPDYRSQWREKHVLSESLGKWYEDKVRGWLWTFGISYMLIIETFRECALCLSKGLSWTKSVSVRGSWGGSSSRGLGN